MVLVLPPPPPPAPRRPTSGALKALLAIAGLALLEWAFLSSKSRAPAAVSSAAPRGDHITNSGYLMCVSEDALKRAIDLSDDKAAFAQFVSDPENGCGPLPANLSVELEDLSLSSGTVKIRPIGTAKSFWTTQPAIRR